MAWIILAWFVGSIPLGMWVGRRLAALTADAPVTYVGVEDMKLDEAAEWLELMTGWPVQATMDPHTGMVLDAVSPMTATLVEDRVNVRKYSLRMLWPLDFMGVEK